MIKSRGFTLIELAIVLVIITILVGGLAMPLSAQIQARRIAETKKTLEEAREAIIGYAMSHRTKPNTCTCSYDNIGDLDTGSSCTFSTADKVCPATGIPNQSSTETYIRHYLPCPDTNGKDGREDRDLATQSSCIEQPPGSGLSHGWLPWVDLGVAQQDAWGNRLIYAVNTTYSNKAHGFSSSTPLTSPLQVCTMNTCVTADVASNVVFVLVSHGPNGWGALGVNDNELAAPTGTNELANIDADSTYVSRTPYKPADGSAAEKAKEFDDLVVWISADQLRGRICPVGGCP